ncbi:MAG: O-methyltransferase [Ignavibacteriaceae bacterium]|nr:O-methyltransferase [Ignavibacteriaceae bacterium]
MTLILTAPQEKYLESFRRRDNELLNEMELFAKEKKIPILSWDAAEFLEQIIKIHKPKRVLEIGTAIAYSSIRMAYAAGKKSVVHTIEKSSDNIKLAREYINRSGCENKIEIFEGDAFEVMPRLKNKYDFIFLDADKEDYKRLLDYSLILLKKGGIIFVDNLLWHGYAAVKKVPPNYRASAKNIKEFNLFFMSQTNLHTTILPIGDGIGLGIKK